MKAKDTGGISQFITLIQRNWELFLNDKVKLAVTFILPIAIGLVITAVTDKSKVLTEYEATRSTLFTIISAAIYTGMFNSLTLICKERSIIKREYMTGMKITSYIFSNVALQALICFIQTLLFMIIYWSLPGLGLSGQSQGVFGEHALMEFIIGLFLVMMASDMMGIFISSIVKSNEIANLTAPIIIIIQLVMSGVLFKLKGIMDVFASLTVSKWGMESLGRVAHLATLKSTIEKNKVERGDVPGDIKNFLSDNDDISRAFSQNSDKLDEISDELVDNYIKGANDTIKDIAHDTLGDLSKMYGAYKADLFKDWFILIMFIIVLSVLSILILRRVAKDQR